MQNILIYELARFILLWHVQGMSILQKRAALVQASLAQKYPIPDTHLIASSPWQLLVAVILSAQCTDARVNLVTPNLFAKWPDAKSLAKATLEEVENVIRSTGFFRNKAKNIIASAKRITQEYNGEVPKSLQELITLPGVARKTANVVLWSCFGINEGIAIDTHVGRIAFRLGLTKSKDVLVVEKDLMQLFPKDQWGLLNHRLVWFGRHVCDAKKPLCQQCEMQAFCPKKSWKNTVKKTSAK